MRHAIDLQELLDHIASKGIPSSSRTQAEFVSFRVWVTPDQICHRSFVGDLSKPVYDFDLIYAVYAGRKPTMDAEDLVVDDDAQGEKVEHVGKIMPHIGVAIFPSAFGVKAVGLGDPSRFVVAPNEMHSMRVPELETDEEGDGLYAEETPVDIVAEKQVVRIRTVSSNLEDFQHVKELSMYVTDDGNGRRYVDDIALFHEQFLCFGAYCFDQRLGQELFAVQLFNALVEVNARW